MPFSRSAARPARNPPLVVDNVLVPLCLGQLPRLALPRWRRLWWWSRSGVVVLFSKKAIAAVVAAVIIVGVTSATVVTMVTIVVFAAQSTFDGQVDLLKLHDVDVGVVEERYSTLGNGGRSLRNQRGGRQKDWSTKSRPSRAIPVPVPSGVCFLGSVAHRVRAEAIRNLASSLSSLVPMISISGTHRARSDLGEPSLIPVRKFCL